MARKRRDAERNVWKVQAGNVITPKRQDYVFLDDPERRVRKPHRHSRKTIVRRKNGAR